MSAERFIMKRSQFDDAKMRLWSQVYTATLIATHEAHLRLEGYPEYEAQKAVDHFTLHFEREIQPDAPRDKFGKFIKVTT